MKNLTKPKKLTIMNSSDKNINSNNEIKIIIYLLNFHQVING